MILTIVIATIIDNDDGCLLLAVESFVAMPSDEAPRLHCVTIYKWYMI